MAITQTFVCREVPVGSINGSNTVFTIANVPTPNSEQVFLNGILLNSGVGNDYTISGTTITFSVPPLVEDFVLVNYFYDKVITVVETPTGEAALAGRMNLIHWCLRLS